MAHASAVFTYGPRPAADQHPGLDSRLAGVSVMVAVHVALGGLVMSGLGPRVVDILSPTALLVTPLASATASPDHRPDFDNLSITLAVDPAGFIAPQMSFVSVNEPEPAANAEGPQSGAGDRGVVHAGWRRADVSPSRTAPRHIRGSLPQYPVREFRGGFQGDTRILVCVSAMGAVTKAELAVSSGRPRLDEATLLWVKHERFIPGLEDGERTEICGVPLTYSWRLTPSGSIIRQDG